MTAPTLPPGWRDANEEELRLLRDRLRQAAAARGHMRYPAPGALAVALDPSMRNPEHLQLLDADLLDLARGRIDRLMVFMPPQEGKSERCSHYFPLWMLLHNPDLRIGIVSFEQERAVRWGRAIKNDVENFDGEDGQVDLGLRLRADTRSAGRWKIEGRKGGVYCVGISGALTGEPLDLLIIDDPVKGRQEADSAVKRQEAVSFWQATAGPRLSPGAPVLVIQTRWHPRDLSGWILDQPDAHRWRVRTIRALAEDDDPCGRQPGEWLRSARSRTDDQWAQIRAQAGEREFAALYQQRPAPKEGGMVTWAQLEACRAHGPRPFLVRVVTAVDPSAGGADEAGIVTVGLHPGCPGGCAHPPLWRLADDSGQMRPAMWARRVWEVALREDSDALVIEMNLVPEFMREKLDEGWKALERDWRQQGKPVPLKPRVVGVRAKRGQSKVVRAEPVAQLFAEGQIGQDPALHFPVLDDQWATYQAGQDSPDRLDAEVYCVLELLPRVVRGGARIVSPVAAQARRDAHADGPRQPPVGLLARRVV